MTILITGANKGIGYAMAEQLVKAGHHVLIGARNAMRGNAAMEKLRKFGKADYVPLDLSENKTLQQQAKHIGETFPELSVLINNAAIPGDMNKVGWEFEVEELMAVQQVNFFGAFVVSKTLLPVLIANRGTILNVSIPIEPADWFNPFAYQTSKAPLNVFTKSWGLRFEKENIPVTIFAVMPGATATDLNGHKVDEIFKTPARAAELILQYLFDGQNHNRQVLNYDGKIVNYSI